MLANARSLYPKIHSMYDYFNELNLHFAAVSETWFREGTLLEKLAVDMKEGEGLEIIYKNRNKTRDGQCVVGGGVAVVYNPRKIHLKPFRLKKTNHEIMAAVGNVPRIKRKLAIISVYLPPNMRANSARAALKYLSL